MSNILELYAIYQKAHNDLRAEVYDFIYQHGVDGIKFTECHPYGINCDSDYYDRILAVRLVPNCGTLEVRTEILPDEWIAADTNWSEQIHVEISDLVEAIEWTGCLAPISQIK